MLRMTGTLQFGPFFARADEAMREAYLMNVAMAALNEQRLSADEIGETLGGYVNGDLAWDEAIAEMGGGLPVQPFDLIDHLERQREFSLKTFGPGPRTKGVLDHIRKELAEIEAKPDDIEEWVDVIILAFDGAWRAGWQPEKIVEAIVAKQAKNEARDWPDWRTADPEKAIEHVRTTASEGARFIGMTVDQIVEQQAREV